jgi:hypothetical protein
VKVQRRVTYTIDGEVGLAELVRWIRAALVVPAGAKFKVWVGDDPLDLEVNLGNPLRFTVTFDEPTTPAASGEPS